MRLTLAFLILAVCLLPSCNSSTPTVTLEPVTVQYTAASVPWMANLYNCEGANMVSAEQRVADFLDLQSVDLALRIGQPDDLTSPAYQIGSEDLLVIVNPRNPVISLTAEEVRGLFSGQILSWQEVKGSSTPVHVWVFASSEDVQQIFEQTMLEGRPVTSTARLATGMEQMAQAIARDVNAVGILTRHWKAGNVSAVYSIATVPVLALTPGEPHEAVQGILACLQK